MKSLLTYQILVKRNTLATKNRLKKLGGYQITVPPLKKSEKLQSPRSINTLNFRVQRKLKSKFIFYKRVCARRTFFDDIVHNIVH